MWRVPVVGWSLDQAAPGKNFLDGLVDCVRIVTPPSVMSMHSARRGHDDVEALLAVIVVVFTIDADLVSFVYGIGIRRRSFS